MNAELQDRAQTGRPTGLVQDPAEAPDALVLARDTH